MRVDAIANMFKIIMFVLLFSWFMWRSISSYKENQYYLFSLNLGLALMQAMGMFKVILIL